MLLTAVLAVIAVVRRAAARAECRFAEENFRDKHVSSP
jgi:hypothetical protein